jgi:hypothetical protein
MGTGRSKYGQSPAMAARSRTDGGISDPLTFFTPTDRFNERYEELNNHPEWSFYGRGFPSNAELLEARNRVFARHSRTQFVVLHVGNFAENLANVAENIRGADRRTRKATPHGAEVL